MMIRSGGIVSYFAAAAVKNAEGWSASEVSLADAADIEDVADRLRDTAPAADLSLLFVESDDAYLVVLRLDQGEDLRVFGSDLAFAEDSRLGAILLGEVGGPAELAAAALDAAELENDSDDSDDSARTSAGAVADADPVGDFELLADLGVPAVRLLELCAQEGMLPADITAEICQTIGCGDEVEELREA
jgi:putative tRNA adenosine deaminase-associated protein